MKPSQMKSRESKEGKGSLKDEMKESPAYQRKEAKLGIEKHKGFAAQAMKGKKGDCK